MKKIFFIILFAIFISVSLIILKARNETIEGKKREIVNTTSPSITPLPPDTTEIIFSDKKYLVSWIIVEDITKLSLYSNLENKDSTWALAEKNKCKNLVNGGFYTEDDKPLGLLIVNGETIEERKENSFIPEIFYATNDGKFEIGSQLQVFSNEKIRFALQTGPLLIDSGKPRKLRIKNDEFARRIVVGITSNKQIIFLAVFSGEENFKGPYLIDLPEIINQFQIKSGIGIQKAINLDGGSASAFFSNYLSLGEFTYIGSYFCIL